MLDPTLRRNKLLPITIALFTFCSAAAADSFTGFVPGNLVVSRSVYAGDASTVTVGQKLPPSCPATAACGTVVATDSGVYPNVFNNALVDGSFGVTSPIFLDQLTTGGALVSTLAVPSTVVSTSFSSKSELALNLSDTRSVLTFMAYVAPPNTLDVSNSNTPGVNDPTNPVGTSYYRSVVQVDATGNLQVTDSNAYSGNNGRAAFLANGFYYTVGNSNNGSGTPANVVAAAGAQLLIPGAAASTPIEIGNFSITQVTNPATGTPYAADKAGKDNNFRGLTVFNDTVYITKGSGGNGINTVYQVGQSGIVPTAATAASTAITILPGFPTTLAKNPGAANPFGIWFANATTLYVADEGDGAAADAANSKVAGLEKWMLVNGRWQLAYVLQNGLNLGVPYSVNGYPSSLNPATDGLRNLTGRLNADGTATLWATTSTISNSGDQGADPNKLVSITDIVASTDTTVAAAERFTEVRSAGYGEVLRGVSFTPGTPVVPAVANVPVTTSAFLYNRVTKLYTGTLSVENNTGAAIAGPINIGITNLAAGVTSTSGSINVSVPGPLAPGQTQSVTLSFADPSNARITFTPVVSY